MDKFYPIVFAVKSFMQYSEESEILCIMGQ
jgi:hypothetical protein